LTHHHVGGDPWDHCTLGQHFKNTRLPAMPIGLKLKKTPSQVNMMQKELSELSQQTRASTSRVQVENIITLGANPGGEGVLGRGPAMRLPAYRGQRTEGQEAATSSSSMTSSHLSLGGQGSPGAPRMKASNFPASTLQIGKWKKVATHEGELIAKCYYAKKKLVWEVLQEHGTKSKIEICWSDISKLSYSTPPQRSAFLEIELANAPSFKQESDPQPRRHTMWVKRDDFTEGQASLCRPHRLFFAPGVLTKHIDRLLKCDERLRSIAVKIH